MPPKLYGDRRSPCVRAVLLTAKVLNIELDYIHVDVIKKEQLKPEYVKINPRHSVPTLDDNGFIVWDSHAIIIYLSEKYGNNNPIYPADIQKRTIINQMLFYETGDLFAIESYIVHEVLGKQLKKAPEDAAKVLDKGYEFLETFLNKTKYVAGDTLTVADFSFWTTLSNAQVCVPIDPKKYPKITEWLKNLNTLPYKDLCEDGYKEFKLIFQGILN